VFRPLPDIAIKFWDVPLAWTRCETRGKPGPFVLLRFETFYEAVVLPKLNGVAINRNFCQPPRLILI
jgi:hypothetical protein